MLFLTAIKIDNLAFDFHSYDRNLFDFYYI